MPHRRRARSLNDPALRAAIEQAEAQGSLGHELITGCERARDGETDQQHDDRLKRLKRHERNTN